MDLLGLGLLIGLLVSGTFLMHSMEVSRSVIRVRVSALMSIVFMIGFMLWYMEAF